MKAARGFTLFEFAVCASLCAVLAGTLLSRLRVYQRESERVAVEHVVASIRTALSVRAAREFAAGGEPKLRALAEQNPLSWMGRPPRQYQGEFYRLEADLLKPGHWYFDRSDKSVNFLHSNDTFSPKTSKLLRFKVKLLREPDPNRSGGRREATGGLVFVQLAAPTKSDNH